MVDRSGPGAERFAVGERVGVAWLGGTDGSCRFCRRGQENLCVASDLHRLGRRRRLRRRLSGRRGVRVSASGRASTTNRRRRCSAPGSSGIERWSAPPFRPAAASGIYGFGGSAHLTAQVALAQGLAGPRADPRGEQSGAGARAGRRLGRGGDGHAARAAGRRDHVRPGRRTGARLRCSALDRGGTLAMAGIWSSDIPCAELRADPVRRTPAAQRHRQHPAGRRDVPRAGRAARRTGDHASAIR